MWFHVVCTLINNEYASLLFSQTFFSYCLCMLSESAKLFERKVWRVQLARKDLTHSQRETDQPSMLKATDFRLGKIAKFSAVFKHGAIL